MLAPAVTGLTAKTVGHLVAFLLFSCLLFLTALTRLAKVKARATLGMCIYGFLRNTWACLAFSLVCARLLT